MGNDVPYCDSFQFKMVRKKQNSFLAKGNFSSKNFARPVWGGKNRILTYWQKGFELFLIGLFTNLEHGDVTMVGQNSITLKRLKVQAVFSNNS